ncbi:Bifunctional diguanylate cyclase/phosphodiesterase OS=Stutzerimonas stutzeri OX=316 GN=CXK95_12955 PE=4 SV=1 [Stutzerimonas stutzeri]
MLSPGDSTVKAAATPASIVLFVDVLDAARLAELGQDYAVDALRVADTDTPVAHGATAAADAGRQHRPDLDLETPAARTTRHALGSAADARAGGAGAGRADLVLLGRLALRTVQMMDTNYARLASKSRELSASEARFRDVAEAASDWVSWKPMHRRT